MIVRGKGKWESLTEVRVLHGFGSGQPLLMVIAQKLVQQVKGLRAHQVLVLRLNKLFPALACLPAQGSHHNATEQQSIRLHQPISPNCGVKL